MPITRQSKQSSTAESSHSSDNIPVAPWLAVIFVLAIYFGSMAIGQIALSVYPLLQGWSVARTNIWLNNPICQFVYVALVEAVTVGFVALFLKSRRLAWSKIGLVRYKLHDLGVTLLAYPPYFVLNAIVAIAGAALFHVNNSQSQQTGFESARSPSDLVFTFISLVVLPPIVEEIVMRGFLFGSLKSRFRVIPAALITSVIFATAHLQFGSGAPLLWSAALDTFVLSLVLCYIRQKTGSLWPGIGLHALKNGVAFFALFILPKLSS